MLDWDKPIEVVRTGGAIFTASVLHPSITVQGSCCRAVTTPKGEQLVTMYNDDGTAFDGGSVVRNVFEKITITPENAQDRLEKASRELVEELTYRVLYDYEDIIRAALWTVVHG